MAAKWEKEARREQRRADRLARRKVDAFLKELTELTQKHGLKIGGCGDCGSPWVCDLKERGSNQIDHLYYCPEHKVYGAMKDHKECR